MATESKPIVLQTPCPDFELEGVDGKTHRLDSFQSSSVLVIGVTCNHCPYVQAYESRIISLVSQLQGKSVSLLCVNANDEAAYPEDSLENMKARAKKLGFNFPYLRDPSQQFARALNAACTPEFYVFDRDRKLRYHGRLDDAPKDPSAAKTPYLKNAIEDLLDGKAPRCEQTSAIGCSVKWK